MVAPRSHLCLLALVAALGCSASDGAKPPSASAPPKISASEAQRRVEQAYVEWKGSHHRLGGTGRGGIDCSAFVQTVYREKFGVRLPRTAKAMAGVGTAVERRSLRAGDLVFFKPDGYPHHVGIYIGDGDFVHVSTKKGVMISSTEARYWARHYWTARRVLR
jgi:cell wall-associated NlpC family hydrolase